MVYTTDKDDSFRDGYEIGFTTLTGFEGCPLIGLHFSTNLQLLLSSQA